MKKIYYGALALLLMAGCTNDDLSVQPESVKSISKINAVLEESPDTRVHSENELKVVWDEGDDIAVMTDMEDQARLFTYESGETTGVFVGRSIKMDKELYGFFPGYNIYPTYNVAEKIANVRTYRQYHHEGEFTGSVPMAGKSQTDNLTFKQVVGIVKISLKGTSYITNLTFSSNAGEKLSGSGYVDLKADDPKLVIDQEDSENNSEIYMESWVELNKDVATDFYFQVPPMTLSEGFTLIIEGRDENNEWFTLEKKSSTPLTIKRGYLKAYTCFDTDEEIEAQEEAARQEEARTREVLRIFYDALGGDNWYRKNNWNTDAPLSQWYGLEVDYNGHLTGINLWDNHINGSIPKEIAELKHLKGLHLGYGNVTSIPDELCQMDLEVLSLRKLGISSLPDGFGNLTHLTYLDLAENQFTAVPECIKQVKGLQNLDISMSSISGELPEWISELTNLSSLYLQENEFEGMIPAAYFTNLTILKDFYLANNCLTGTITVEMQQSPMWKSLKDGGAIRIEQREGYGLEIKGAVKTIELNTQSLVLVPGETAQLTATVLPADALNKNVGWGINWIKSSWNNPPFTIDENGLVTALCEGEGQIFVKALDNNGAVTWCYVKVVGSKSQGNTENFTGTEDDWDN